MLIIYHRQNSLELKNYRCRPLEHSTAKWFSRKHVCCETQIYITVTISVAQTLCLAIAITIRLHIRRKHTALAVNYSFT